MTNSIYIKSLSILLIGLLFFNSLVAFASTDYCTCDDHEDLEISEEIAHTDKTNDESDHHNKMTKLDLVSEINHHGQKIDKSCCCLSLGISACEDQDENGVSKIIVTKSKLKIYLPILNNNEFYNISQENNSIKLEINPHFSTTKIYMRTCAILI